MSTLIVDKITSLNNTITIDGNLNVSGSMNLNGTNILTPLANEIVQQRYVQTTSPSHITVTSLSEVALTPTISITPRYANSIIRVEFYSTMMYGAANAITAALYRKIGAGSFTSIIAITQTSPLTYYGWFYHTSSWGPSKAIYFDSPATTQQVTYELRYRNISSTATNYLVHQTQYYGWIVTELKV
jgi:hypothetical protein